MFIIILNILLLILSFLSLKLDPPSGNPMFPSNFIMAFYFLFQAGINLIAAIAIYLRKQTDRSEARIFFISALLVAFIGLMMSCSLIGK